MSETAVQYTTMDIKIGRLKASLRRDALSMKVDWKGSKCSVRVSVKNENEIRYFVNVIFGGKENEWEARMVYAC